MTPRFARTADPYRDLDVIDARAPRFNQATIGMLSLVAVASGWWPILAVLAAQLGIGLTFGRRWCLPCVAYFELVQPRFGEGPIEDSRPPRFANQVGLAVLAAASGAYLVGAPVIGAALGLLVAALALLAASTGLCAGCSIYRLGARLRGISARQVDDLALAELGITDSTPGEQVVAFTHPLCTDCRDLMAELRATGHRVSAIDVRERPDLARKYGVAVVPMAFTVDPSGAVLLRIAG
ncbi:MAG TPA: DUF4395 domain-containing protein [Methylomirabilota bacterium]|nr:DUF4395 domain-containing protein [Methylomirabilota bacterium]